MKFTDADVKLIHDEYPVARRSGPKAAGPSIRRALKDVAEDHDDPVVWLLARVVAYSQAVDGKSPKFIPMIATWMNQQRYYQTTEGWLANWADEGGKSDLDRTLERMERE